MDRASLEGFLRQGLSLEQIGREVGRHPSTVGYWLKKHGLRAAHRDKHLAKGALERAMLEPLLEEGLSIRQIAAELGVSATTVRHWLKRHGLKASYSERRFGRAARAAHPRYVVRACSKHGDTRFVMEGRGYYRCAQCRQDRVARWRRRMKRTLVAELGGRCSICGYDRYIGALEFHHLDRSAKEFGLSDRGMTRSLARLRVEVRKCILLCANCHAEVEGRVARYSDVDGPGWPIGKAADC
jgi:transposase-like protein